MVVVADNTKDKKNKVWYAPISVSVMSTCYKMDTI